jgi:sortase A
MSKKANKRTYLRNRFSLPVVSKTTAILFGLGLLFLSSSLVIKVHSLSQLSFTGDIPTTKFEAATNTPKSILIPKIQVNLTLEETYISKGVWQVSESGASHLATSATPAQSGNIIIYAHNTRDRFGRLSELEKGDLISVTTNTGTIHTYKVSNKQVVDPTYIQILMPTKKEILTLYTCYGFADLKRIVIQAAPVDVSPTLKLSI